MHSLDLILTLTGGLGAALVFGYIAQRVGLSPIVGYLMAGIAVGPNTPGFVADRELAKQLAEIGVVLLMFGVGLHFHFKELLAVRGVALPGAIFQSLVATGLGAITGRAFGWGWGDGLVFGLAVSVASTVVLTRVLADNDDLHSPTGHTAVGWLVVEDLLTVVVLVLLPALVQGGGGLEGLALIFGATALKIAALVVLTFTLGDWLIPRVLALIAATRSRELFTLAVLALALGIAVGSAKLFGVSMELGAFLAGMVVGRSEFSLRAASEALPMRDAFAVLFFVSTGMLFDPGALVREPALVATTLAIILVGKPLAALVIVLVLRRPLLVGLSVAVALAQIGEFSFILADLGARLGVLPPGAINALVAAAILSISINPILYRVVEPVERWLARRPRLGQWLAQRSEAPGGAAKSSSAHRAVVVGYGPVGRTLSRLLRDNGVEPTIVEMNLDTVQRLRQEGVAAVYGDAGHAETLKAAGVESTGTLILSASGLRNAPEIIRLARELSPRVRVLVRCAYLHERALIIEAGANAVFTEEGEVALAMTESILRSLGAVPEQIDRERERARGELFGRHAEGEASAAHRDGAG